ncbi:hypothetical protein [Pontibacter beigongshangensis]|uniref:hypothetical protein n=1 Tax=Pontibacter beigongshangensis TaxID=2574733 RepID=UPI001F50F0A7|nr:hypothetical protein [Pontibacter beigongshangensis]
MQDKPDIFQIMIANTIRNSLKWLLLFAVSLALFGCSPSTQITGSWKSPEATSKNYSKIIVAALTDSPPARQIVENELQAALQTQGVTVTKSIDEFPPAMMRDRSNSTADGLLKQIRGDEHDAILTVAVVDQETETRYVPGHPYAPMSRFGWYGTFRGYYSYRHPMLYSPGYYTEEKVYFLETNLYDAETEKLLWSAQSRTYSPSSLNSFAGKFATLIVNRMQAENVL